MFKNMQAHYGWVMFTRMFRFMQANHIRWSDIDGGKNPSPILTNLVTAYLVMGSGASAHQLDPIFTSGPIVDYDIYQTTANVISLGYGGALPDDGTYTITSVGAGLALDADAGRSSTKVSIETTDGAESQRWVLKAVSDGVYTIHTANRGLALDAGRDRKGTTTQIFDANDGDEQLWSISALPSGYILTNTKSGLVLDTGSATSTGSGVTLNTLDRSAGQRWIIHAVPQR